MTSRAGSLLRGVMRRLLVAVPLLLAVLTLVFLLVEAVPGDPFAAAGAPGGRPESADRLRQVFGTERPALQRYGEWLVALLEGDLGLSYSYRRPVSEVLGDAVRNTLLLSGLALVLQFAVGTAAGTLAAGFRRRWLDRAVSAGAVTLYALPSYWLGLLLVSLFSVGLGWFPASQMRSIDAPTLQPLARLADVARHLALPCLALTLPTAAGVALYVRDQVDAALSRRFVTAARARGLGPGRVVIRHGLRSSLLPLVQLVGLSLPSLVGGSVVVEALFAWPGIGALAYQAVLSRDQPLILGCTLLGSVSVVAGSLLADLLGDLVDPRAAGEST